VGLVPLFAAQVLEHSWFEKLAYFKQRYEWLIMNRLGLSSGMVCIWTPDGTKCLLSIVNYDRLRAILRRVLDETEFLSPNGLRSLSRYHLDHPFVLAHGEEQWTVRYEPGESTTRLFGGNSNWRGPVWFPTAFMLITALRVYDRFYGDAFQIECPTGSGVMMTLNQVALEIGRRLCTLFTPTPAPASAPAPAPPVDAGPSLAVSSAAPTPSPTPAPADKGPTPAPTPASPSTSAPTTPCPACGHLAAPGQPHLCEPILFHEYFDGDTGRGLGAPHQTGWTALVAKLLDQQASSRR
jgi:hypothetical protein